MNKVLSANKRIKNGSAAPPTIFWIVVMAVFLTELLFYTWCRVQYTKVGYTIAAEKESHQELQSLQKNLEIELTKLKSPNRIASIARNQLGLDIPKPNQIRSLP